MSNRKTSYRALFVERLGPRIRRRLLHLRLVFDVVEAAPGRERDAKTLRRIREHVDLDVLLRPATGKRWVRRNGEAEAAFWRIAERVPTIELRFTVTEDQLTFVTDEEHQVVAAFGGQRGGKTHAACLKHIRCWLLQGGRGVMGLSLSPSKKQTQIIVRKLCKGEDANAPLLPAELVLHYPERHESGGQYIEFVDGTQLVLDYVGPQRQGGNIKGVGPRWIGIDEVCEIPWDRAWKIIRGRVSMRRGGRLNQCFMSSTPEPAHWAEKEIVMRADRERGSSRYWYCTLSMKTSPFVSELELEEAIEDQGGEDDPICQREVFGLWKAGSSRAYYGFETRQHVRTWDEVAEERKLRDVTRVIGGRFFRSTKVPLSLLGGQDFNLWPCSTVLLRIGQDMNGDYVVVVTAELLTRDAGTDTHAEELFQRFGPLPIACDPAGAQYGDVRRVASNRTDAIAMIDAGHDCRACNFSEDGHPYAPPQKDTLRVVNLWLKRGGLYIDPSCVKLIEGLARVQATLEGGILKFPRSSGSNRPSDRDTGPTDALRYIMWALFGVEVLKRRPSPAQAAGFL